MSTPAMHSDAAGASDKPEATCAHCQTPFKARRGWGRFCGSKCRNDFHARERRKKLIEARALVMFEVLTKAREFIRGDPIEHAVVNFPAEPALSLGAYIDKAIKDLKAP